jgi:hypothetical protein
VGEQHRSSLLRTPSIGRSLHQRKRKPGQKPGQFKQRALLALVEVQQATIVAGVHPEGYRDSPDDEGPFAWARRIQWELRQHSH